MLRNNYATLLEAYKQGKINKQYLMDSIDVVINLYEYRRLLQDIEEYEEELDAKEHYIK